MNFSSFFGVVFAMFIFYQALHHTSPDVLMFLDLHGLIVVLGGTLAAASISFPILKVISLLKVFFLRVLGKNKADYQTVIQQIIDLNKKASVGLSALKDAVPLIK